MAVQLAETTVTSSGGGGGGAGGVGIRMPPVERGGNGGAGLSYDISGSPQILCSGGAQVELMLVLEVPVDQILVVMLVAGQVAPELIPAQLNNSWIRRRI